MIFTVNIHNLDLYEKLLVHRLITTDQKLLDWQEVVYQE